MQIRLQACIFDYQDCSKNRLEYNKMRGSQMTRKGTFFQGGKKFHKKKSLNLSKKIPPHPETFFSNTRNIFSM